MAKGYAAQRAANVLRDYGVERALVSLGESSVTAVGGPPGATGWPLFIRDPRDGETASALVELRDGESLATSGTYEKTVSNGKARRSHIIDPHSGQAIGGSLSVTVLLDDAEAADALTKPFLLTPAGTGDWAKWLAAFPKASIMLMVGGTKGLEQTTAGTDPERFVSRSPEAQTIHAAETH
jgi:thiamine biosynthesis lipoprotein